ncbi:MAG TPA: hypothetical protein VKA85_03440 [Candidatus Limnocylindrales bacterium]|nr:hypothetical protein [Candidatus Limnocylindrales bacterium]
MSDDRTFDRIARSWLETGPTKAPEAAVENALLAIESTPQERDLRVSWRLPTMNNMTRLVAALAIAILAVGAGVVMLRPTGATVGSGPSSAPATSPPSPTVVPSSSAAAAVDLIPEGTYVGPTIQVADIVAFVNADTKLTAKQKTFVIEGMFAIKNSRTWVASLEFRAGKMTQRQDVDGTVNVGSGGAYSFLGTDTLVVKQQDCAACYLVGFTVVRAGDGFTLTPIGAPSDESDAIAQKYLYGSGPFTRVP